MRRVRHAIVPNWERDLALTLLVALGIAIAGQMLVGPARSHEWYPPACCSGLDCAPMGTGGEPEPIFTRQGWRLRDGVVVPHDHARPSPDGRFHICRRGGRPDGEIIIPTNQSPCLWVPQGAS